VPDKDAADRDEVAQMIVGTRAQRIGPFDLLPMFPRSYRWSIVGVGLVAIVVVGLMLRR
jgi:hypothetical protein